jgi:SH3-like domain-containing protein
MKTWSLAVMALAVMSAGAVAQDVKGGEEKVAFEKKSYPYEGEVTVERLNVRMFPKNDQTSIITSVLGLGEKVTVVAEKDEYYQILPPKNSIVWVTGKNIKRDGDKGVASTNEVPVRLDSRINADVLCTLKEGDAVKVVGEHMGWLKIEAPAAVKYYVGKKYVHTSKEIAAVPVNDEKKAAPAPAKKAEALGGSDVEARRLIANAQAELERQSQLVEQRKFEQVDLGTVVADYEAAKDKATTDAVKTEAERGLSRSRELQGILTSAKVALLAQEAKRKAELEALNEKKNAEKALAFQGYIEPTGVLFKRPGTHKLVSGGRIVCFLRVKDGDEKMLGTLNNSFQKLVGINGTVINNPEGWDGYKVVVVDEFVKLEKDKE